MKTIILVQGICILFYTLLVSGLLFVSQTEYKKKYYVPVKMICSSSFLVIALLFGYVSRHWIPCLMLFPGILFCAIGDYFMGRYQILRKNRNLILGIVTFMMGHICLLAMLFQKSRGVHWWNILLPLVALMILLLQKKWLHLHYGKAFGFIVCYTLCLSLMLSKALEVMVLQPSLASAWIGVGGILFFVSDYTINFCYFYKPKKKVRIRWIHVINLITYFFGILALDISILYG